HSLIVAYPVGNLECIDLGKGNANVLCVTAAIATEGVTMPDNAGAYMTVTGSCGSVSWIRVVATRKIMTTTRFAKPACENRTHHDTITGLERRHLATDIDHLADELVAEHV